MNAGPQPQTQARLPDAPGTVVFYPCHAGRSPRHHESVTQHKLACLLAEILDFEYAGEFDPRCRYRPPLYFVPSDTLGSLAAAQRLGLRGAQDLFGGVVPFPFVATKLITHPLPGPDSPAPQGWASRFAQGVQEVVLPGFSVFSRHDAEIAAARLLSLGAVRLKKANGIGGVGQAVITAEEQLARQLEEDPDQALLHRGLVLERNLTNVQTYSVGQVQLGTLQASYVGTQKLTRNNRGEAVYGGSHLTVARGGFASLERLELSPQARLAVEQASLYHRVALASFPGMFASRCNYDVAQGYDESGGWHSGVLEQSWRIGGASGAELAALQAFRADPLLDVVCASTTEIYGPHPPLPPDAQVYYSGKDEHVGWITKYSRLEHHGHPG